MYYTCTTQVSSEYQLMCNDSNLRCQLDKLKKLSKFVSHDRLKQVLKNPIREYLQNDAITLYRIEKGGETHDGLQTSLSKDLTKLESE